MAPSAGIALNVNIRFVRKKEGLGPKTEMSIFVALHDTTLSACPFREKKRDSRCP